MAKENHELLSFNRGVISPLVLARVDVPRVALSAEEQTNWIPRALGAMSLRPGLQHMGDTTADDYADKFRVLPFVVSNDSDDRILVHISGTTLAVWSTSGGVSFAPVEFTGPTPTITNGTFTTDLTGWTDSDESGGTSEWLTGGYLSLLGDGTNAAQRDQQISVGAFANVAHAIRVTIARGPVLFRIGSAQGGEQFLEEKELQTGTHVFTFTPTANFWLRLAGREEYPTLVDAVAMVASSTEVVVPPWTEADLPYLRYAQSGDVMFIACDGYLPRVLKRWGYDSWSFEEFTSNKGPFRAENLTQTTITPSALTGSVTLTASKPVFKSGHVGAIFSVTSDGQTVTQTIAAQNTFTDSIKVTGVGAGRIIGLTISGSWSATVTLQRSVGIPDNWVDVTTFITNASTTLDDALDNQIVYYRIGVKTAQYVSGTAVATLTFGGGSITGVARITAYSSATSVTAIVLKDFGNVNASDVWAEGEWSAYRGYPSAVVLREGRLWFAGKNKFWGSVVDDFNNHDPAYVGDAGPINRSIGEGPLDRIQWLVSVNNLIAGGQGGEFLARSSTQEEPITPLNFNVRPITTIGSTDVDAVVLDGNIIMADRSTARIYELEITSEGFNATDLSLLAPELFATGVVALAVQRRPDTRVHAVMADGTVALLVYNAAEEVRAWVKVETSGTIVDVAVLPGDIEDQVFYVVDRGDSDSYRLEKWALISECVGGTLNKQLDAFVVNSAVGQAIGGLAHLEGETVAVWSEGVYLGTYTVASGSITVPDLTADAEAVVGLPYTARFKSTKLAPTGYSLVVRKRITHVGVLLTDTHAQGVQFGPDFDNMDGMPLTEGGAAVDQDGVWANYNYDHIAFRGTYTVDSRLCLKATAPKPATLLAVIIEMEK